MTNETIIKQPYRIGTTSYIYPDKIIPNVHKLKTRVNDIELLLFEVNDENPVPSKRELEELRQISIDYDLTYTIHMPLHLYLGSNSKTIREKSIDLAVSIIKYLSILKPYCYIFHLNISDKDTLDIKAWQLRIIDSIKIILNKTGCISKDIAIENINYPFSYVDEIIANNNLSICIDIGHLIIANIDIEKHFNLYSYNTKVIHLHGVNGARDHVSLKYLDMEIINNITIILKKTNYDKILTLEIFSEGDFEESISIMNQYF